MAIPVNINNKNTEYEFVLSPRSRDRSRRLGAKFNYKIAQSNQAVLDNSQMILLCLPGDSSEEILSGLNFGKNHNIMSTMAGVSKKRLHEITKASNICVSMMPGYANASNKGPSLLFPKDPEWQKFLSFLGPVFQCENEKEFNVAAVIGAVSGASFVLFETLSKWFTDNNLSSKFSQKLLLETLRGNIDIALESDEDLSEIISKVSTPGGITETLVNQLDKQEALSSWKKGMDIILKNSLSRK